MALATTSTPGSVILGGDLTGLASAPELRVSGVTPGAYSYPSIAVDAKGRVIYATGVANLLVGDVNGPIGATVLSNTAVAAGSYAAANITVDAKGRVTSAAPSASLYPITFTGDLSGVSSGTSMAVTQFTAGNSVGTFTAADITVDSKGRITSASNSAAITVNTDATGTQSGSTIALTLANTTVTAGSYSITNLTVDSKGRVTAASSLATITISGDASGTQSGSNIATTLVNTAVTPGAYNKSSFTVDSKGRITTAAVGNVSLSGELTGTTSGGGDNLTATLGTTGVSAGAYTAANVTVNDKGHITAISNGAVATTSTTGVIRMTAADALSTSAGIMSLATATTAAVGVVDGAATNAIGELTVDASGNLNINTSLVASKAVESAFTKAVRSTVVSPLVTMDLDATNDFYASNVAAGVTLPTPTNGASGNQFSVQLVNNKILGTGVQEVTIPLVASNRYASNVLAVKSDLYLSSNSLSAYRSANHGVTWAVTAIGTFRRICSNGSIFCLIDYSNVAATTADGITKSSGDTLPYTPTDLIWDGTYFIAFNGHLIHRSTDGLSWTDLGAKAAGFDQMCVMGGQLYALDGQIVRRSADNGNTWTSHAVYSGTNSFDRICPGYVYSSTTGKVGAFGGADSGINRTPFTGTYTTSFQSYYYHPESSSLYFQYTNRYEKFVPSSNTTTNTTLTSGGYGVSMAIGDYSGVIFCETGTDDKAYSVLQGGISGLTTPMSFKFSNTATMDLPFGHTSINFNCTQVGSTYYCTFN